MIEIRLTNSDSDPLAFDQRVLLNTVFFLNMALSSTTGHDRPMLAFKVDPMIWISLRFIDVLLVIGNEAAQRRGSAAAG